MRSFAVAALLLVTASSQASAQVSFSSVFGAPDVAPAGTNIVDFNSPLNAAGYPGIAFSGSYSFLSGSIGGQAAEPNEPLTPRGFFSVPTAGAGPSGTATIDFQQYLLSSSIQSLSFYWGSIDLYNTLEVLDADLNPIAISGGFGFDITGGDVFAQANGNQTAPETNRRVTLDLTNAQDFRALRLTSSSYAFEIDDIYVQGGDFAEVPEPATASVLALGLALLGAARSRRNRMISKV